MGQLLPLFVGELGSGLCDGLHGRGHVVVALGLLGQLGALDLLLFVGHDGGIKKSVGEDQEGGGGEKKRRRRWERRSWRDLKKKE